MDVALASVPHSCLDFCNCGEILISFSFSGFVSLWWLKILRKDERL